MRILAFVLAFTWSIMLSAMKPQPDCPPHFDLGMTYKEIKAGPCPSIDTVASFRAEDGIHVGYYCAAKRTMVVGDMTTGKADAFFLYNADER